MVTIKQLSKVYGKNETKVSALTDINLTIASQEFIAIVGSSGSGKSTLLNLLGGIDLPTKGEIQIYQQDLAKLTKDEGTIFRRRNIGFIFQNYNLLPVLNVYDNIVLPLNLDGVAIDHSFLETIVSILGLTNKLDRMPNTLSGGQQQRVAIARALITKPAIILADEPTGNLDSRNSMEVMGLIQRLAERFQQTIIVVTHDEEVAQLAQRMIRIEDGKIVSDSRWQV
ncbi:ABC transporter ATP-binding protein [Enterococcus massiliensis]|nr:ABC transporter ATP-binding protein [Enterococcus massiliensis]